MYILIFLLLFLAISIIVAVMALSIIIGLIQTRGVPFVSTGKENFDEILLAVKIQPGEKIYDLGCGKAHFLILAAKKYGAIGVGYELSLWPYLWAKFNVWRHQAKVDIFYKNFFKADLADADVVFCYLFPEVMAKLESKFQKELKPGARVVSYAFKLPKIQPTKIEQDGKIMVYEF